MRSWSKWVIFSRRMKSSMSDGPRAPARKEFWSSAMGTPWSVVSFSPAWLRIASSTCSMRGGVLRHALARGLAISRHSGAHFMSSIGCLRHSTKAMPATVLQHGQEPYQVDAAGRLPARSPNHRHAWRQRRKDAETGRCYADPRHVRHFGRSTWGGLRPGHHQRSRDEGMSPLRPQYHLEGTASSSERTRLPEAPR